MVEVAACLRSLPLQGRPIAVRFADDEEDEDEDEDDGYITVALEGPAFNLDDFLPPKLATIMKAIWLIWHNVSVPFTSGGSQV